MLAMQFPPNTPFEKREGWAGGGEQCKMITPVTTLNDRATYYHHNTEVQLFGGFIGEQVQEGSREWVYHPHLSVALSVT